METDYYINVSKDKIIIFYCAFKEVDDKHATEVLDEIAKFAHKRFGDEVSVDLYRKVWVNGI